MQDPGTPNQTQAGTDNKGECPVEPSTTVGLYDRSFKPLLVTPLRQERDVEFGPLTAAQALSEPLEREEESAYDPSATSSSRARSRVTWSPMSDVGLFEHEGRFLASGNNYLTGDGMNGRALLHYPLSLTVLIFPLRCARLRRWRVRD
eukprot:4637012-Prymnesium_polylepis.1